MKRLLRGIFKLGLITGVGAGLAVGAKKLMGGLGPTPGSPDAPKEWPSLVPDPESPASGNGSATTNSAPAASSTSTSASPLADEAEAAGDATAAADFTALTPSDADVVDEVPTTEPEAAKGESGNA